MRYAELYDLVKYNNKETNLYMPNEIFNDLQIHINNTPHISFAYTYMYFVTWLYRYAKNVVTGEIIDNSKIKEILGYNPKNQTLNYLIKRNGLLEDMEYLKSTRDFPVSWTYSDLVDEGLDFQLSSVYKDFHDYMPKLSKQFSIKYPIKAFSRITVEDEKEFEIVGTFYDVSNSHNIPFEVFLYCMSNKEIGCTGFYLYAYLKHKNDMYEFGYDVSLVKLAEETGIAETTLDRYLGNLKRYKLIDFEHNQDFFVVGMKKEDRKANTYMTREHNFFLKNPVPFKKIEVMKKKEYIQLLEITKPIIKKVDIPLKDLPY